MTTFSGKPFEEVPHFTNSDNNHVFCKYWNPDNETKGLVLIVHGFGEHCARYDPVAEVFNSFGLLAFSQDHVGHGESEGERCDVTSYEVYLRDLLQHVDLMKKKHLNLPFYLFGHSMGGALAILLAHRNPGLFKSVVLSSPMIAKNEAFKSTLKVFLVKNLSYFLPQFPAGELDPKLISRSSDQVSKYKSDPLVYHGPVKLRMAHQMIYLYNAVEEALPHVTFPFIVLHGDKDGLVDVAGSRQLMKEAKSEDKTIKEFKGACHELIHEIDDVPQVFLQEIRSWIASRL